MFIGSAIHRELYYSEYRKKFKTEHSVAEITKNKTTPDKLSLVVDGKELFGVVGVEKEGGKFEKWAE